MLHVVLLGIHIAAGISGLILGPLAMAAPKGHGRHPMLGRCYQLTIAALTCSAMGLVALDPGRLWGFGIIAVATEVAALAGWAARRRHRPGWLPLHVGLMLGSYVSLVTALWVVNSTTPLAWILPTVIGTPLIAITATRAGRASRDELAATAG